MCEPNFTLSYRQVWKSHNMKEIWRNCFRLFARPKDFLPLALIEDLANVNVSDKDKIVMHVITSSMLDKTRYVMSIKTYNKLPQEIKQKKVIK